MNLASLRNLPGVELPCGNEAHEARHAPIIAAEACARHRKPPGEGCSTAHVATRRPYRVSERALAMALDTP